jgi:DNA-binding response OmpR family regulator
MKGRLFLIHWDMAEAEERAGRLRAEGWEVEVEAEDGAAACRRIKEARPVAVVVELTRLPSHGRETADSLRRAKATRAVPILFVGGRGLALAKTRAKVPDAVYTTPEGLAEALATLVGPREVEAGPASAR